MSAEQVVSRTLEDHPLQRHRGRVPLSSGMCNRRSSFLRDSSTPISSE